MVEMEEKTEKPSSSGREDHLEIAQCAFDTQNYTGAVLEGKKSFLQCISLEDDTVLDMMHRALEIINESLVMVWSMTDSDQDMNNEDIRLMLTSAAYVHDTIEAFENEKWKMEFMVQKNNLETMIGNLDPVWSEKNELRSQLKNHCDMNGEEKNPIESAKILRKMALAYAKHDPNEWDIYYSHALLAATLLRDPKMRDRIQKDVKKLNKRMFKVAGITAHGVDLIKTSDEIRKKVQIIRTETATELDTIQKILKSCDANLEANDKESNCIENVMKLVNGVSENYTTLMREISENCIDILGPVPCDFAHVFMEPVASLEITPFSAFKDMIILDNDSKKRDDYESILDYFKWYSVIFHIIILYFMESPLNLVGIPTLNDFHFHNNKRDWFRDYITPDGIQLFSEISPDREMIHGKPHGLALIKTSKEMAKYFANKKYEGSNRKLSEMPLTTCCINGSRKLHVRFGKRVRKSLLSHKDEVGDLKTRYLDQMKKNLYKFSFENAILRDKEADVERVMCGTITTFIRAIGNILEMKEKSCFGIIEVLKKSDIINEESHHDLMFAVAITCIVHMMISVELNEQIVLMIGPDQLEKREKMKVVNLLEALGKSSIFTFLTTVYNFQYIVNELIDSQGNVEAMKKYSRKTNDFNRKAEICIHFGLYEEALSHLSEHIPEKCLARQNVVSYYLKGICNMKFESYCTADENFSLCLGLVLSLPEAEQPIAPMCIQLSLGQNMRYASNFLQAMDYLHQAKDLFETKLQPSASRHDLSLYISVLKNMIEIDFAAAEYEKVISQCEHALKVMDEHAIESRGIRIEMCAMCGESQFKMGNYKESIVNLENAITKFEEQQENPKICDKAPRGFNILDALVKLCESYFKTNRSEIAEKYCEKALEWAEKLRPSNEYDMGYVKLILSKCLSNKNKLTQAAIGACEAFSVIDNVGPTRMDRTHIIHEAVKIIFRSLPPVRNKKFREEQGYTNDDIKITLDCATKVYNGICDLASSGEFESDKSILIRLIQNCIFQLSDYNLILRSTKPIFMAKKMPNETDSSFPRRLLIQALELPEISENIERDYECLKNIATSCNIRDCISYSGAIIIFAGWLFLIHRRCDHSENLMEVIEEQINLESDEDRNVILHSAVKVGINTIENNMDELTDEERLIQMEEAINSLLNFSTKIYAIIHSCENAPHSLMQESAGLINSIAQCWMKMNCYEEALNMFNEALLLQEKLSKNNPSFQESSALLEKITTCLSKLKRLDEAKDYLQRIMLMKDSRRKSMAYEDHSILQVRVQTAQCSFELGNFPEAAQLACEAFHEGLGMEPGMKRDAAMMDSAIIIQTCTLKVSIQSLMGTNTETHSHYDIQSILDYALTLFNTLKDTGKQLGKQFSDMKNSLQYAIGNCHYTLGQFKPALRCFKKILRISRGPGNISSTEKSLMLSISKCLLNLKRYKEAQLQLEAFIATEKVFYTQLHLHHSHAHNLLGICLLRQHRYREACCHAFAAVIEAHSTPLQNVINDTATDIFLETINEILLLSLD